MKINSKQKALDWAKLKVGESFRMKPNGNPYHITKIDEVKSPHDTPFIHYSNRYTGKSDFQPIEKMSKRYPKAIKD